MSSFKKSLIVYYAGVAILPSLYAIVHTQIPGTHLDNGDSNPFWLTTLGNSSHAKTFSPLPGEIYTLIFLD